MEKTLTDEYQSFSRYEGEYFTLSYGQHGNHYWINKKFNVNRIWKDKKENRWCIGLMIAENPDDCDFTCDSHSDDLVCLKISEATNQNDSRRN